MARTTSPTRSSPHMSWFSARRLATALLALTLASSAVADITLTFLDADGAQIGEPQPIPLASCTNLNFDYTLYPNGFASVKASEPQAALNLYDQLYCPFTIRSAVGQWASNQVPGTILAIRHEGNSVNPPGTISEKEFPKGMIIQTQVPDPEEPQWVMDPDKARSLVIVVAVILVIGVAIGVYQVFRAAQYKPPPKKPKKQTGLNTKKIKKKDAYFKKPMKDDEQSFQRLHNDSSPEPSHQMMERSRESQYSEGTYMDWTSRNNSQLNVSHANTNTGARKPQDTSIDMRGSPSPMGNNRPYTPDLINFDNNSSNTYNNNNNNNNNNNSNNNNNFNNNYNSNQRGRGGEVLVPMHNLDYSQNQGRSAVRRSSSSRSR